MADSQPIYIATNLIDSALNLRAAVEKLRFSQPVAYTYNPLTYAWPLHEQYLRLFAASRIHGATKVLFVGMNPGPWGMAQTGVPFGEIAAVRDWLGLTAAFDQSVKHPTPTHPKRPLLGLTSPRSEVSGRRFWGLMADRFGRPADFFANHFVLNYCPLLFLEASARNLTPNKLTKAERQPLEQACDSCLQETMEILRPSYVVGIGQFAHKRIQTVLNGLMENSDLNGEMVTTISILHPSPASPAANRGWAEKVTQQLQSAGVWSRRSSTIDFG